MALLVDINGKPLKTGPGGSLLTKVSGFLDTFSGSPSDPSVDATRWTQLTRTGAETGIKSGQLVCDRVSAGVLGHFSAYVTNIYENGVSDVFTYKAQPFFQSSHWLSLYFRHASKSQTKCNNENADAPNGYELLLHDESWGAVSRLVRYNGGAQTAIGADFTATGLDFGVLSDVRVVVTEDGDSVDVEVKIDGSTVMTRSDTAAGRISGAGFSGLGMKSDDAGNDLAYDDFGINV